MATFYVPLENTAQPLDALRRWFFLVIDAPDAYEAFRASRPEVASMNAPLTTWWPQDTCPDVSYMQKLRSECDEVTFGGRGRRMYAS